MKNDFNCLTCNQPMKSNAVYFCSMECNENYKMPPEKCGSESETKTPEIILKQCTEFTPNKEIFYISFGGLRSGKIRPYKTTGAVNTICIEDSTGQIKGIQPQKIFDRINPEIRWNEPTMVENRIARLKRLIDLKLARLEKETERESKVITCLEIARNQNEIETLERLLERYLTADHDQY